MSGPQLRVELASASWLDDLDTESPVVVALPLQPDDDSVTVIDPDNVAGRLSIDLAGVLAAEKPSGEAGSIVSVPVGHGGVDKLLLVGLGDGSLAATRSAAAAIVRRSAGATAVATPLAASLDQAGVRAAAEAAALAAYSFDAGKAAAAKKIPLDKLMFTAVTAKKADKLKAGLGSAAAVAKAVLFARDLVNTPSLVKTPDWMAKQAVAACKAAGVTTKVRDVKALEAEGFGGILAVGAGSDRPPRLIEMSWSPVGATKHIVLIGKGITFDSGGLSLKPNDSMVAMKTDMAGGAAVIATMTALRDLGVKVRVTGLVPLAENLPGASATRPGDVLRHWGGRTVEVLNTDAEGRLVLADALAYAVAELEPDAIVDIATLTGAASLGLGKRHGALYATDESLGEQLLTAGATGGERLWLMPFIDEYRDALESPIADLRNIADPSFDYSGGSIMAALFLREFVGDAKWAHLDVAGPARADADEAEISKGATGFGVRTFCRWLENLR